MENIYHILDKLGISYDKYEHPAVFTNEESAKICTNVPGKNTKNLFLADDKNQRFYLLTVTYGKKADLKKFAMMVGERKLHFANKDYLKQFLNLTPGSVSPLGLMYDKNLKVKYFIDSDLLKEEKIYIHPNINTATVGIKIEDFKKFINFTNHQLNVIASASDLSSVALAKGEAI
jgi:Ala-tRNA(Pro) deacylase